MRKRNECEWKNATMHCFSVVLIRNPCDYQSSKGATVRRPLGNKPMHYLKIAYQAARFSLRNRAALADAVEVTALALLAYTRAASPTGKMYLGQVRAKARRMSRPALRAV